MDYVSATYKSDGEEVPFKIWDTAGQDRFKAITYSFYKQANGVIIAFDVTRRESFENVKTWVDSIYEHADPKITKVLVGNKIDLENDRVVKREEAEELAKQHQMRYFETSAKANKNIGDLMQFMMGEIYKSNFSNQPKGVKLGETKPESSSGKKGGCCGSQ